MLTDPNSKFALDSSQLQEFVRQSEQITHHLTKIAIDLKNAVINLQICENHNSYIRDVLNEVVRAAK